MRSKILMILSVFFTGISGGCTRTIDNIVVVGITNYDRKSIAQQVQNICALNPKVIAIDVQFPEREDYEEDNFLRSALSSCPQVILPSQIKDYTYDDINYEDTLSCDPFFRAKAKTGFVNVILENDEFYTLKRFSVKEKINGKVEYQFAVQTAMAYDSVKALKFIKANPKIVEIKYQTDQTKFTTIRGTYALYNELSKEDIEGKIVLLGAFWPIDGYQPDVFVSPLNKTPEDGADMWGVMYLANVVAQILE